MGYKFVIESDHKSLTWLKSATTARLIRWACRLSEFDYEIRHKPGKLNTRADMLSRLPQNNPDAPMCRRTDDLMFNYNLDCVKQAEMIHAMNTSHYLVDMSPSEIVAAQENDPILKTLRESIELMPEIIIKEGMMYCKHEEKMLLLIPESLKTKLLEGYHNHPYGGDLSKDKLYPQLKVRFYWEGMEKDVQYHTRNCIECLKVKTRAPLSHGLLRPIVVERPFQLVGVDIAVLQSSQRCFRYILVTVDYFTNWVEAIPMKTQQTDECIRAFYSSVISKHGCPEEIMSDSGTQFLAGGFSRFCELYNIKQRQSAPYLHQANGKVEKFIGFLKAALSLLTPMDLKHTWDDMIDHCLFVYRTSYNRMLGDTPFFLLHGRDALLPQDMAFGVNTENLRQVSRNKKGDYRKELVDVLTNAYQKLIDHKAVVQDKYKRCYDKHHKNVEYQVGDHVLVLFDSPAKGCLMPRWEGPFKVIAKVDPVIYRLENEYKITTSHVHRMVKLR